MELQVYNIIYLNTFRNSEFIKLTELAFRNCFKKTIGKFKKWPFLSIRLKLISIKKKICIYSKFYNRFDIVMSNNNDS